MKKKLESELMSIAHKILKLKGKEEVNKMHAEVTVLYEKLSVLKFAQDHFEDHLPTIGNKSSFFKTLDTAFNSTVSETIENENKTDVVIDGNKQSVITEPVTEKTKDIVTPTPQEAQKVDAETQTKYHKNDFEEITADFNQVPVFEKLSDIENEKKSLNDKLKSGGLKIGLNDKLAFTKYLFDGKNEDYDRVVSQLNTINSLQEASHFINTMVKPDYNNWEDKEEYSERFIEIIEAKYN